LDGTDIPVRPWALRTDCGWIPVGQVHLVGAAGTRRTYEARLDLAHVAREVIVSLKPGAASSQLDQDVPTAELDAGEARVRLFVEVACPSGVRRRGARLPSVSEIGPDLVGSESGPDLLEAEASCDNEAPPLHYPDPLGRYRETNIPKLYPVETPYGQVTPYINRQGVLSALIGPDLAPVARVRNDWFSVRGGTLRIRGKAFTRHVEVSSAQLLIQGRTSGYRRAVPVRLVLDEEESRRRYGLRSYSLSTEYSFAQDLADGLIAEDTADLFIEFTPTRGGVAFKRRFGRSRYRVRALTRGGYLSHRDTTLSIVPYYTYKAKNASIQFELFQKGVHTHLRKRIATGAVRRGRGQDHSRPVWVIGELPYKAQDNGLHFFRYVRERHPEVDAYYVIREGSSERRNLTGHEDHVLDFRSKAHIDKLLVANRIIGSHDPDFLYPTRDPRFRRLVRGAKVFLQHGVTGAKWMVPKYGKRVSNFDTSLICVCSEREKEFFVKDFGYSPEEIAVTGFARFDALFRDDVELRQRQIIVMPTWRPWLQDPETFLESEYFLRWRDLLLSAELRELKERQGADIILCLHPNMQQFSHHFVETGSRVVFQGDVDVQHLIKQSALMVTDYSSVAFDFAFLQKPVIYYQFDADRFDPPHADPHRELPGPVVETESGLLTVLNDIVSHDWAMSNYFWQRAERFCQYVDENNSERIFTAVRDLDVSSSMHTRFTTSMLWQVAYRVIRRHPRYLPTMRRLYRLFKLLPVNRDLLVFESGQGRHFSDSPRYIYEELVRRADTRRKVWIYNGPLPISDAHTTVVKRHSIGFYWYLARAGIWVNNHTFPHYITRRRRGNYIQTWHGTPLKRMFLDQAAWFGRDAGYKARVTEAVAQWSVLVSPSPYATACMRSAYDWDGPVVEVGYPRNDVLLNESADAQARSVRERLGIPADKRVVLYAPTFRDDNPTGKGRFRFDLPLNLYEWHQRFGKDHVLLIRTHVLVSNRIVVPDGVRPSVVDVSTYPDIQELLLVSDVLVTDYSSSFFDFALLGRPIVFYAYDLENYRDRLRGFYLPYDDGLPGPIVQSERELLDELELLRTRKIPDQRVLDFASVYAPYDDGHAAARVVDRLL
jgi:CDP-glycerol glycerophosphotransferase